ncbi:MAG: hypothetical protein ACOY31_09810 [Bacillota bacterium]
MYNYHAGEIKNPGLELVLILFRIAIIVFIVSVASGVGIAAGLPPFVGGIVGGLFTVIFFCGRPFFEVINYNCPHCGNQTRVIKNFGSFRCANCGKESVICD